LSYSGGSNGSNASNGKTPKDGVPVKKKRPAEELVDRVFRKLPPAKLGKLKMKPGAPFKHKRRHSADSGKTVFFFFFSFGNSSDENIN
jgi:hypothetical protein